MTIVYYCKGLVGTKNRAKRKYTSFLLKLLILKRCDVISVGSGSEGTSTVDHSKDLKKLHQQILVQKQIKF